MVGTALVFLAALVVLIVVVAVLTASLVRLVLFLVVAGLVGWVADYVVPGELPFGWIGAIAAGLLGSWLGALLLGPIVRSVPILNLSIAGIHIFPAIVGAIVVAFVASLVFHRTAPARLD